MPLYVDLDGTLVRSDLLVESFFAMLRRRPWSVFAVPLWMAQGRAVLKARIAERATVDPKWLPYNEQLLEYLHEQRAAGRSLVLATSADETLARRVADHLGIFDDVLASDGSRNLSGRRKTEAILARSPVFDYAGNGRVDLAVWERARRAVVVEAPRAVVEAARRRPGIAHEVPRTPVDLATVLRAVRLHQWLKNLLVFVPPVAAHAIADPRILASAAIAFVCFGLVASATYLLNDLMDLPSDRRHPRKRMRPLACGRVSVLQAALASPALLLAGFALTLLLPPIFTGVLALYLVTTVAYSLRLKRVMMLDVILLAGLYTLRVLAGSAATLVAPSFWLLAFCMFIFLSLALIKRYTELVGLEETSSATAHGRGYIADDRHIVRSMGVSSGFVAVLVLALYVDSDTVNAIYRHPEAIWLLCPLLLYWIARMWIKAHRGDMHDDPLVFALADRVSLGLALAGSLILWAAS